MMIGIIGGDINGLIASKVIGDDCIILEKAFNSMDSARLPAMEDFSSIKDIVEDDSLGFRIGEIKKENKIMYLKENVLSVEKPDDFDRLYDARTHGIEVNTNEYGVVTEGTIRGVLSASSIILDRTTVVRGSFQDNKIVLMVKRITNRGEVIHQLSFDKIISTIPFWKTCDIFGEEIPEEVKFLNLISVMFRCNPKNLDGAHVLKSISDDFKFFKLFLEGQRCRALALLSDEDSREDIKFTIANEVQMLINDPSADIVSAVSDVKFKHAVTSGDGIIDSIRAELKGKNVFLFGNSATLNHLTLEGRVTEIKNMKEKILV